MMTYRKIPKISPSEYKPPNSKGKKGAFMTPPPTGREEGGGGLYTGIAPNTKLIKANDSCFMTNPFLLIKERFRPLKSELRNEL